MSRVIAGRLLSLIPVLVVIAVVTFLIIHLTPGNPAEVILGNGATQAQVNRLTKQLGLDRPIWVQFGSWVVRAVHGNLGTSLFYEQPVVQVVLRHLPPTLYLAAGSTLVSVVVALPIGLVAAARQGSLLDRAVISGTVFGVSIPNFWLALMLIVAFAVELRVFPVTGYVSPGAGVGAWLEHLVLPVVVLAAGQCALIARMLRDGVLESLNQPYIRTARAEGASERVILVGQALPNALIPTLTVIGNSLASLLSGVVIVEVIFGIPGIGNLIIQAVDNRDYPLVEGITLMLALIYVVVNLLVDMSYIVVDPRLRRHG